ncbi:MAG: hypothetical protein FJX35_02185 [Alphaproteobacteria bacterium]|nr:hypothetical protein [Alphaproteobacteria bacterium]
MTYDLPLRRGPVIDQGLDGRFDVAVADGRIAAVAPNIPAPAERHAINVTMDSSLARHARLATR